MVDELKPGSKIALAAIPLARLIAKAVCSRATVILSVKRGEVTKNLFLKDGEIIFANSNSKNDTLKVLLMQEKKLSRSQVQIIDEHTVKNRTKFIDALVALGYYPAEKVDDLKRRHVSFTAIRAFELSDGFVEIIKNESILAKITPYRLETYALVAEGVKQFMTKEDVCKFETDIDPQSYLLITERGEDDSILEKIPPEAKGIITIIQQSPRISDVVSSSFLKDDEVYKHLYFLKILGLVNIETQKARDSRLLDKSLSDEEKKQKFGILNTLENFKTQSYYEILGVLEDASQNELEEAKEKLAEKFKVSKYQKLFWGDDKYVPGMLLAKIEEAYHMLSDTKKRSEYDSFLARGEAHKFSKESSTLGSDEALKAARNALDKKDYTTAAKHYEQSLEYAPNDTSIMCELAQAIYMESGFSNTGAVNRATDILKKAHSINPQDHKIFLLFGRMFKARGKSSQALESFKKSLFLNPSCGESFEEIKKVDPQEANSVRIRGLHNSLDKFNYYEILDIDPHASADDIKSTYHKATKTYHPDRHFTKGNEELKKMTQQIYKRIVEAYMVLKNPTKRKEYDAQLGVYKREKEVRLKDAADVVQRKEKSEILFKSKNAKKFFELGLTALAQKKINAAKMNFQLALQAEPDSVHIKRKLKEVSELEKKIGDDI